MKCPVCKRNITNNKKNKKTMPLVTARYEGILDIPKRKEQYRMHGDCAAAYHATEKILIATGHIQKSLREQLMERYYQMVKEEGFNLKSYTSALNRFGAIPGLGKPHDDRVDAFRLALNGTYGKSAMTTEILKHRELQGQSANLIIIDDMEAEVNKDAMFADLQRYCANDISISMGVPTTFVQDAVKETVAKWGESKANPVDDIKQAMEKFRRMM